MFVSVLGLYGVKRHIRGGQTFNPDLQVVLLSTTVRRWVSVWLRGFTLWMIYVYWILQARWLVVLHDIRFICLFLSVYQFCSFTNVYFLKLNLALYLEFLSQHTCDSRDGTPYFGKAILLSVTTQILWLTKLEINPGNTIRNTKMLAFSRPFPRALLTISAGQQWVLPVGV